MSSQDKSGEVSYPFLPLIPPYPAHHRWLLFPPWYSLPPFRVLSATPLSIPFPLPESSLPSAPRHPLAICLSAVAAVGAPPGRGLGKARVIVQGLVNSLPQIVSCAFLGGCFQSPPPSLRTFSPSFQAPFASSPACLCCFQAQVRYARCLPPLSGHVLLARWRPRELTSDRVL